MGVFVLIDYILDPEIPYNTEISIWHSDNLVGADMVQLTSWVGFWPATTNCIGFGLGNVGSGSFGTGGEYRRFIDVQEKGFGFGPDVSGFGIGRFGIFTGLGSINCGSLLDGDHSFNIKLRDSAGNISDYASELITTTFYNIPNPPTNAAFVSGTTTSITLTWNLSTSL